MMSFDAPQQYQKQNDIKQVVDGINRAVSTQERVSAIHEAKKKFDHNIMSIHDLEIEGGAANALCLQLGYALNKKIGNVEIMKDICHAIEHVYRCSDNSLTGSFELLGKELMPLLMKTMRQSKTAKFLSDGGSEILLCTLKILHIFSKVESAANEMAGSHSLLSILISEIAENKSEDVKIELISTLKNLSFYAEERRINMVEQPGLISSIIELSFESSFEQIRENVSGTIRNLALASDTKVPMAQHGMLLNAIIKYSSDKNPRTKFNAVTTLSSLAVPSENSYWLVNHSEGAILNVILNLCTNDEDLTVRRKMVQLLRKLTRRESASMIVGHEDLINKVSQLMLTDADMNIKLDATKVLTTLVIDWDSNEYQYPQVISTTMKIFIRMVHENNEVQCLEIITKAFENASKEFNKASLIAKEPGILSTLLILFQNNPQQIIFMTLTNQSLHILQNLSSFDQLHEYLMFDNNGDYPLLSALVLVASTFHQLESRNAAVQIISQLSGNERNYQRLVKQKGLLHSLVQYITSDVLDISIKEIVRQTIMRLIPHV